MRARSATPNPATKRHRALLLVPAIASVLILLTVTPPAAATGSAAPSGVVPLAIGGADNLPVSNTTVTTQMTVATSNVTDRIGAEFWAADLAPSTSLTSHLTSNLEATPISWILWPSAKMNDHYDLITNTEYGGANPTHPPTDAAQFVQWCESIGCHAVLGIPGEINNTSFAVAEVEYVEDTLGFHPAAWEIGNEPGLWDHYDVQWTRWSSTPHKGITAEGYAQLVNRYVAAIHKVDASARILGLAGTGLGAYQENDWVYDTVKLNGPNITGIAVHTYPAGFIGGSGANLSNFDYSLRGHASVEVRLSTDEAAMRSACPSCDDLQIFVTEFNAAVVGAHGDRGVYASLMNSYYEAPYMASMIIQGLAMNVSSMYVYNFESGFPGALTSKNAYRSDYYLYSELYQHLLPTAVQTTFSGSVGNFFGVDTLGPGGAMTLLMANANPSENVQVELAGSGFDAGAPGTVWTDTPQSGTPSSRNYPTATPESIEVPAEGIVMIQVDSSLKASPTATVSPVEVGGSTTIKADASGGTGVYTSYVWGGAPPGCIGSGAYFLCVPTKLGTYHVWVNVTDSADNTANGSFELTVHSTVVASVTSTLGWIDVGQATTISADATGGSGSYSHYRWSGLPPGCAGSGATVVCVPTVAGSFNISVNVTDSKGNSGNSTTPLTLRVSADPTISVAAGNAEFDVLESADTIAADVAYSGPNTVNVTWFASSSNATCLPGGDPVGSGSSFTPSTGTAGTNDYCAVVSDSGVTNYNATSGSGVVTVAVFADPTVAVSTNSPSNTSQGENISISVVSTPGAGNLSYAWSGLPPGCSSVDGPTLDCAPTASGTYQIVVTVRDRNGVEVESAPFTITVKPGAGGHSTSNGSNGAPGGSPGGNPGGPTAGVASTGLPGWEVVALAAVCGTFVIEGAAGVLLLRKRKYRR
jgi:hypothetical protein